MLTTVVIGILAIMTLINLKSAVHQHSSWKNRYKYKEPDYIHAKEAAQARSRSTVFWLMMTVTAYIGLNIV